ncbi:carbamoyltransferase HypF [Rodentibacter trehalosifermentans]|uniref:Carbamoyltransferase HypF n=1 Tax=Rodentibacter trehalosifermentans TaxID=1908263 RepID=A0A1V3IWU4_9PAST|nr:carbamoyltransferase HypF [Rodentibacter trehalosifermentans]OOF46619.1 carbamoyltransferase HypF [Rodentibacter trehalosifermentans]
MNGIEIRIKGKVQGVGFRPFVWLLANEYELKGDVNNDGKGVLIRFIEPNENVLQQFLSALQTKHPPLALITDIQIQKKYWENLPHFSAFIIRETENNNMDTQIVPDAATCPACIDELFNPKSRRYHYPFTNCTHCGPRFTIIKKMPYDRQNTAMADFPLCPECTQEYKNPANRRFHAQPNACIVCGPHIWLQDRYHQLAIQETALKQTALLLHQGKIAAIKGIGGFHLACDARNKTAVTLLRERKHRPSKPLAIMVPNLDFLRDLNEVEIQLLTSTAAPIVLLTKHKVPNLASNIAPDLNEIGVMLPSNPLQHLLLREMDAPLVMTSANPSGQPPVLDNESAVEKLADLADIYLCHNRDILQRADDSLVRVAFDGVETLRRARGYVPDETILETNNTKNILALGSDLKNTFCLLKQNKSVVSQHIGDTANVFIQQQLENNLNLFSQIYQFKPNCIAVDAHQGYFSSKTGKALAEKLNVHCVEILHHHAHIAAVLAEYRCNEKVIGIALDGIGMGENGQLWGGECLLVEGKNCQHLGGLPVVALPGGDIAASQPWRNWLAHLQQFVPNWRNIAAQTCQHLPWEALASAIERRLNSPLVSSTGRLFDAVAYGLGIAGEKLSWEGEAACHLEALAAQSSFTKGEKSAVNFSVKMPLKGNRLDLATFWQTWLAYEGSAAEKAFAFHYALAKGFSDLARQQAQNHGCRIIVLSGGVMHNQLLRRLLKENLAEFTLLSAHQYPMGDGGLSLGQASIASSLPINEEKRKIAKF